MDTSFASFARTRAAARARGRHLASGTPAGASADTSPNIPPNTSLTALLRIDTRGLIEHPRGCELREAVRLLDGYGRLKAMYATIQAAVSAAISGDEIVIAAGVYAEDLHINSRLTLTRAAQGGSSEPAAGKAVVVGQVVVAASAVELVIDGVAIEGGLTMQSVAGTTAAITLRSSGIQGSGVSCARLAWLPHVCD